MKYNIIDKIIKNTTKKLNKISKLLPIDNFYKFDIVQENDNQILYIYRTIPIESLGSQASSENAPTQKLILKTEYTSYGKYQPTTGLWFWISSIFDINKEIIKNINKLKSFYYLFEIDNDDRTIFYYQLLTKI